MPIFDKVTYVEDATSIDTAFLRAHNIETLLIDADNTLLAPKESLSSPRLKKWVANLKEEGFDLYLISNNTSRRIDAVCEDLGVEGLSFAHKPLIYKIRGFLETRGIDPAKCAFLGDQLFTDMIAARRLKMFAIMVAPISENDYFYTRWIRRFERFVLRQGGKK